MNGKNKLIGILGEAAAYPISGQKRQYIFEEQFPDLGDPTEPCRSYRRIVTYKTIEALIIDDPEDMGEYIRQAKDKRLSYQTCTDGSAQQVRLGRRLMVEALEYIRKRWSPPVNGDMFDECRRCRHDCKDHIDDEALELHDDPNDGTICPKFEVEYQEKEVIK